MKATGRRQQLNPSNTSLINKTMKNKILNTAQEFIFKLFKESDQKQLIYHNYIHTYDVVSASADIAEGSGLKEKDIELLLLSAWFHDAGYVDTYKGHELVSTEYASKFLKEHNYSDDDIAIVTGAILATEYPQRPKTLLEEILCDADFSHFGDKDYIEKGQLLRLEWELMGVCPEDDDWPSTDVQFLSEHSYFTEFSQRKLTEKKGKNILKLREIQAKKAEKKVIEVEKLNKLKTKKDVPERGIETMFRVSFKNHMALSGIADNKANIMLSINAIIISISLSTLIPNFDENPQLIIPTMILLLVCIVTIVFATLSTRPKISKKNKISEPINFDKTSLLFFGNFYKMPLSEFETKMDELMINKKLLYGSLTKDIYNLGVVLGRKYKFLRICYNIFMYGMIVSVATFLITFLID